MRYTNTGMFLKNRREQVGLTQVDVGQACALHQQFVSNWERGLCMPPRHCLSVLSKVLQLHNQVANTQLRKAIRADMNDYVDDRYRDLTGV